MTTTAPFTEVIAPGVHRVFSHAAVASLREFVEQMADLDGSPDRSGRCDDIARIDQLAELERLKAAAAAAQARLTREFEKSQLDQQDAAARRERERGNSVRADRLTTSRGRGIGDQVALARNDATSQGARHLAFARAMEQMPHTLALLTDGQISEWTATLLVRETDDLSAEHRTTVDTKLCATTLDAKTGELHQPQVLGLAPRRVANRARALANQLDAEAATRRAAKANSRRRVTIRPTPSTMSYVTGLLPVRDGVAVFASLESDAKAAKAAGDARTVSQLMADLLVQRVTGAPATAGPLDDPAQTARPNGQGTSTGRKVPVRVHLVMSADTFLADSDQPARTSDGTVIPADEARAWVHDPSTPVTIRRLFTDAATGVATDADPRARKHSARDKAFLRLRDQSCRIPGCDRSIDDIDHPERHADGGASTRANGQGVCEGHNLAKEAPGWRTRVSDPRPGHHEIEIITPTGHTYRSKAPPAMPPPL